MANLKIEKKDKDLIVKGNKNDMTQKNINKAITEYAGKQLEDAFKKAGIPIKRR